MKQQRARSLVISSQEPLHTPPWTPLGPPLCKSCPPDVGCRSRQYTWTPVGLELPTLYLEFPIRRWLSLSPAYTDPPWARVAYQK
eukprot:358061-Prorocentrum_minimum.AAC.1